MVEFKLFGYNNRAKEFTLGNYESDDILEEETTTIPKPLKRVAEKKEDLDAIFESLKEIESTLSKDKSGSEYLRSAKFYVGTAILLANAEKRTREKGCPQF